MVSTFGANSGLILSGGRDCFMLWQKTVCFFKQATELNKTKFQLSFVGTMCLGCVLAVSGSLDYSPMTLRLYSFIF
jgi:APA family basic amino acid/polyamine antiporter